VELNPDFTNALIGGIIIGLATVLMMHFNGRVTGISGIINGLFAYVQKDWAWRWAFAAGLLAGGFILNFTMPQGFVDASPTGWITIVSAGLLVGFGTLMGSGCTSGHGVCGISRLSIRSLAATVTLIVAGILTVFFKHLTF
jgi:uncharacterized membrane protein YedE/YeeE